MKGFQRLIFISILGTYLVILAGAVVRGTGSGLGCPDWPRCFGQWVPPVDISELPENYKEVYKIAGKTIADFDPFKTWTEYLNRLLGVLLGLVIIALFVASFGITDYDRNLPWYCAGLLLLILVQGGVGALVVFSHLKPFLITIHMFLAVLLLFRLLKLRKFCFDLQDTAIVPPIDKKALRLTRMLVGLTFFQALLGTQVRQRVDHLLRDTLAATPETVIGELGAIFYVHRTLSLAVLGLIVYLLVHFHRSRYNRSAFFLALMALLSVLGNVVSGVALNYFDFPAAAQPPHLFFGVAALGFLYGLRLQLKGSLLAD